VLKHYSFACCASVECLVQAVLQLPLLHALSQHNLPLGDLGWYLTAQPMQHSRTTCQVPSNSSGTAGVKKPGTEQQQPPPQQQQQGLSQQEKTAIGHGNGVCSGLGARLQLGCTVEQHGQQGLQDEVQQQQQQQYAGGTAPAQQLLQKHHPGTTQLADQPQTAAGTQPPEPPPHAGPHQQALMPTQQESSLCTAPQPVQISNTTTGCQSAAVAVAPSAVAPPTVAPHSQAATVDLDLLALLFTAAKVLFCGGALQPALQLLQLCSPAQAAAAAVQPLHESRIRNEAAYAALLQQLLVDAPPATCPRCSDVDSSRVLFVCGDSHILPREFLTAPWRTAEPLQLAVAGCSSERTSSAFL